jgi:hypothetical protein
MRAADLVCYTWSDLYRNSDITGMNGRSKEKPAARGGGVHTAISTITCCSLAVSH